MAHSSSAGEGLGGWLNRLARQDAAKRAAISAFLLFHLLVISAGAIPTGFFLVSAVHAQGLLTRLTEKLGPYGLPTGLQVGWSMFAPNPSRDNTYIDAEIGYRDGR